MASRFMRSILIPLMSTVLASLRTRLALQTEILALRHQIIVLRRSVSSRPKLRAWDRFLWIWLLRLWAEWRPALIIVKPETVIAWHRKGVRLFWTWKSRRGRLGRPRIHQIREKCSHLKGAWLSRFREWVGFIIATSDAQPERALPITCQVIPH